MSTSFKLLHAIIFQTGWFVCILTNNTISLAFTFIYIAAHIISIYFLTKKLSIKNEASWLIVFLMLGFICETAFFNFGLLSNTVNSVALSQFGQLMLPPIWLLCLWILFAISMRTSLAFMFNKPLLAYTLISISAPCSYYAGAKLNSQIEIAEPLTLHLLTIALTWLLILSCILAIQKRYFKDPLLCISA